jgi:hypothetical protein
MRPIDCINRKVLSYMDSRSRIEVRDKFRRNDTLDMLDSNRVESNISISWLLSGACPVITTG